MLETMSGRASPSKLVCLPRGGNHSHLAAPATGLAQPTKGRISLAFPEIEKTTGGNTVRIKRQLVEQAIGHGAAGRWAEAAETNRKILEIGPDP